MRPAAYATVMVAMTWTFSVGAQPNGTPDPAAIEWPDVQADREAMIELGRHLFFDPRLVLNEQQSCASCHSPHMGYADGVALDLVGHKDWALAKRNSPSLYNLAWAPVLHWDGRTPDGQCFVPEDVPKEVCLPPLESQAFKSMRSRKVYEGFLPKVKAIPAYREMFAKAFVDDGAITHVNMAFAIAAFERTLISVDSAYDRYVKGDDTALSAPAKRGLALFQGKGRCVHCHGGPNFTDWDFHNIGLISDDPGRAARVEDPNAKEAMLKAFRTPGLRNVSLTAPYMHDGSLGTLEDVVAFYDRGGDDPTNRDVLIQPLGLSARERWQLVEFLNALTAPTTADIPSVPK